MIEFKAECGHTVRARDEDGGGVVRCSYCGRPAAVPEGSGGDLDFLFNDVVQSEDEPKRSRRRRRKSKGTAKRQRSAGEFNPFSVVLSLCYAAVLISIVFVVGKQFVIPLFKKGGVANRSTMSPKSGGQSMKDSTGGRTTHNNTAGRKAKVLPGVLYASSVPSGAFIYCIKADETPTEGRIYRENNHIACANGVCKPRGTGTFVVEVAMPVRHPKLKHGPGYYDFRRQIRDASTDKRRKRAADRYFIPDGSELLVDEEGGQQYIVRQYRNVELHKDRPTAVRALFLPRIPKESGRGFSVDALIRDDFIPKGNNYEFDVAEISGELKNFYEIPKPDRDAVIEALRRVGVISYVTTDGKTRLFKIDMQKGWLAEMEITDPAP